MPIDNTANGEHNEDDLYLAKMTMDEVGADIEEHGHVAVTPQNATQDPFTTKGSLANALDEALEEVPDAQVSGENIPEEKVDPGHFDPRPELEGEIEGAKQGNEPDDPTMDKAPDSAKEGLSKALESVVAMDADLVDFAKRNDDREVNENQKNEIGDADTAADDTDEKWLKRERDKNRPELPESLGGRPKTDENGLVYLEYTFTIDPKKYQSNNYQPMPEGTNVKQAGTETFLNKKDLEERARRAEKPEETEQMEVAEVETDEKEAKDEAPERVVLDYATFIDGSSFLCYDEVGGIDYSKIAMDAGSKAPNVKPNCKTTFAQCRAKNPLYCRFHGPKLLEKDIKQALTALLGKNSCVISVTKDKGAKNPMTFRLTVGCVPAMKKKVEDMVHKFMTQNPGITSKEEWKELGEKGGKITETEEFEIDVLQADKPPKKSDWALQAQYDTEKAIAKGTKMPVVGETPPAIEKKLAAMEGGEAEEEPKGVEEPSPDHAKEGEEVAKEDNGTGFTDEQLKAADEAMQKANFGGVTQKGLDGQIEKALKGQLQFSDESLENFEKAVGSDDPILKAIKEKWGIEKEDDHEAESGQKVAKPSPQQQWNDIMNSTLEKTGLKDTDIIKAPGFSDFLKAWNKANETGDEAKQQSIVDEFGDWAKMFAESHSGKGKESSPTGRLSDAFMQMKDEYNEIHQNDKDKFTHNPECIAAKFAVETNMSSAKSTLEDLQFTEKAIANYNSKKGKLTVAELTAKKNLGEIQKGLATELKHKMVGLKQSMKVMKEAGENAKKESLDKFKANAAQSVEGVVKGVAKVLFPNGNSEGETSKGLVKSKYDELKEMAEGDNEVFKEAVQAFEVEKAFDAAEHAAEDFDWILKDFKDAMNGPVEDDNDPNKPHGGTPIKDQNYVKEVIGEVTKEVAKKGQTLLDAYAKYEKALKQAAEDIEDVKAMNNEASLGEGDGGDDAIEPISSAELMASAGKPAKGKKGKKKEKYSEEEYEELYDEFGAMLDEVTEKDILDDNDVYKEYAEKVKPLYMKAVKSGSVADMKKAVEKFKEFYARHSAKENGGDKVVAGEGDDAIMFSQKEEIGNSTLSGSSAYSGTIDMIYNAIDQGAGKSKVKELAKKLYADSIDADDTSIMEDTAAAIETVADILGLGEVEADGTLLDFIEVPGKKESPAEKEQGAAGGNAGLSDSAETIDKSKDYYEAYDKAYKGGYFGVDGFYSDYMKEGLWELFSDADEDGDEAGMGLVQKKLEALMQKYKDEAAKVAKFPPATSISNPEDGKTEVQHELLFSPLKGSEVEYVGMAKNGTDYKYSIESPGDYSMEAYVSPEGKVRFRVTDGEGQSWESPSLMDVHDIATHLIKADGATNSAKGKENNGLQSDDYAAKQEKWNKEFQSVLGSGIVSSDAYKEEVKPLLDKASQTKDGTYYDAAAEKLAEIKAKAGLAAGEETKPEKKVYTKAMLASMSPKDKLTAAIKVAKKKLAAEPGNSKYKDMIAKFEKALASIK